MRPLTNTQYAKINDTEIPQKQIKLALEIKPTQNSQSNDSPKTSFLLVSSEQKRKFLDLLKLKEYELTHLCRSLGSTENKWFSHFLCGVVVVSY